MRVGAVILSYGLTSYLPFTLKCVEHLDDIVVINGSQPFNDAPLMNDNTRKIINRERSKARIISKIFENEHQARNEGVNALADCDVIFMFDADEVMSKCDMLHVVNLFEKNKISAVMARPNDYWKCCDYAVYPRRNHGAIVAVCRDVEFHDGRCAHMPNQYIKDESLDLEHFGFALTEQEMKWKYDTYWCKGDTIKHTHNVVDGWYDNIWRKWTPESDMINLGMVTPSEFPSIMKIRKSFLTNELKEYSRDIYRRNHENIRRTEE